MFDSTYASVKKMVRKVCQSRGAVAVEKALPRLDKDLRPHMLVEAIAGMLRRVLDCRGRLAWQATPLRPTPPRPCATAPHAAMRHAPLVMRHLDSTFALRQA